ncbi:MAG: putative DNA binding domain-containing protein, partial [Actinobacteria bacterium]|nr:putative DNA binding domain-containing protein [Actinomycetota bacterium]
MSSPTEIVAALRKFGAEATSIEAKLAATELPKSVLETLSAFSNTPGGGTLILGLEEHANFSAVGVKDPKKLMADLAAWARTDIVPPLTPVIELGEVDGRTLVIADIPELPRAQKPGYVRSRGLDRGSFVRIGEGDRRLTSEEVHQLVADRGQPLFDQEPILEASPKDLDPAAVARYVDRLRNGPNRRIFENEDDGVVLRMTRVTATGSDAAEHPTLAGLLALGRYPQQFFPQLNLTFVYYPTAAGADTESGMRFLDNASIDGPIPLMVEEALSVIQR